MIPVEQRFTAVFDEHGDVQQRGDCLTACIASLFELPIEDVPFFVDHDDWWARYQRFLHERGFQLGQVNLTTDDDDPLKLTGHPTAGIYWLATVRSPRGKTRCSVCDGSTLTKDQWDAERQEYVHTDDPQPCNYCKQTGLVPCLHSIVMCGGEIAWDPHPQRHMGHLGWVSGEWLIARDPAALTYTPRELKEAA